MAIPSAEATTYLFLNCVLALPQGVPQFDGLVSGSGYDLPIKDMVFDSKLIHDPAHFFHEEERLFKG